MRTLNVYEGKRGNAGADGINGLGVSDVNYEVNSPLCKLLFNNNPSPYTPITASRNTPALFTDRYGKTFFALGESVTSLLEYSNDFNQWGDPFGRWSIIGSATDPFGGNDATEINLDVDTSALGGTGAVIDKSISTITQGEIITVSFYIKVLSGSLSSLDFTLQPFSTRNTVITPSDEWVRIEYPTYASIEPNTFSINPRGLAGTRVAVYQANITDTPTAYEVIPTTNAPVTITFDNYQPRDSNIGYYLESSKTNLAHNSNNLLAWTQTACTVSDYLPEDPFGNESQSILVNMSSLPDASIETTTDLINNGVEYSVSFYVFLTEGSMKGFSVELGNGIALDLDIPPVTGFVRYKVKLIAGSGESLKFNINSPSLTAKPAICGVQIEEREWSSFIFTGDVGQVRSSDVMTINYDYNVPKPSIPWSASFRAYEMPVNAEKKYIFSNGLATTNEFSVYFENDNLVVNLGGNTASENMILSNQIGLIYDGSNVKFYDEKTLVSTVALASGGITGTTLTIGENASCYISNIIFYSDELSDNDMIYLQGL